MLCPECGADTRCTHSYTIALVVARRRQCTGAALHTIHTLEVPGGSLAKFFCSEGQRRRITRNSKRVRTQHHLHLAHKFAHSLMATFQTLEFLVRDLSKVDFSSLPKKKREET